MRTPEKNVLFLSDLHINSIFAPSHKDYDKGAEMDNEFKKNLREDRQLLREALYFEVAKHLHNTGKEYYDYVFITAELIELVGNNIKDSSLEMIDREESVIFNHSADFIASLPGVIPGKTTILMCRGSLPHVLKLDGSDGEDEVATLLKNKGFNVLVNDKFISNIKWANKNIWYFILIHQLKPSVFKNPVVFQNEVAMWLKREHNVWIDDIDLTVLCGHNHSFLAVDASMIKQFEIVRSPGLAMLNGSKYGRKLNAFAPRYGGFHTFDFYEDDSSPIMTKHPIIMDFKSHRSEIINL